LKASYKEQGGALMAEVDITVGGRNYMIACRDGGEQHLRTIAAQVDRKAHEARSAVGDVNESRQLLFAALLLADELSEARNGQSGETRGAKVAPRQNVDNNTTQALVTLAARVEAIADALEQRASNA
jgi:cell division protein ZapA